MSVLEKFEKFVKEYEHYSLEDLIKVRDETELDSSIWHLMNAIKGAKLEEMKPSTKESILAFDNDDLAYIREGFSEEKLPEEVVKYIQVRSLLEYNPLYRHPIPYVIIRHGNHYFFAMREKGSGEMMLIGKKGLLGGHVEVKEEDKGLDTKGMVEQIMFRELNEEAGIAPEMIKKVTFKGLIKGKEGVDRYHLGVVYEVVLNTKNIKTEEEGVLSGGWIKKENLIHHYNSFESWAKIVYDNLLKEQKKIKDVNMYAVSNEELGKPIGEYTICKNCGEKHEVIYGTTKLPDGREVKNKRIAFAKCDKTDTIYLVGVDGLEVPNRKEKNR